MKKALVSRMSELKHDQIGMLAGWVDAENPRKECQGIKRASFSWNAWLHDPIDEVLSAHLTGQNTAVYIRTV